MQKRYEYWATPKGRILADDMHKGMMFVNGLYICTSEEFEYGYDFKPDQVKLDRDRKLIPDFDLKWTTSQMWLSSDEPEVQEVAASLVRQGKPDTEYVTNVTYNSGVNLKPVAKRVYDDFVKEHGENAVPITSTFELNNVPSTHTAVIVSETVKKLVTSNPEYIEPEPVYKPTLRDEVKGWIKNYGQELCVESLADLMRIVEEFE
jgi:hypothetical protein